MGFDWFRRHSCYCWFNYYVNDNNPPNIPRNRKYNVNATNTNSGTYFIPDFMSPFCIIDNINDANIDINVSAITENILKSSLFISISFIEKGVLDDEDNAGATVADTPINISSKFSANANSNGLITVTIAPMNIVNINVFAAISSFRTFVFLSVSIVSSSTDAISPPLSTCPNIKSIVLLIEGESYFSENSFSASDSSEPVITFFETNPISSDNTPNSGFIADHSAFSNDNPPFRFVDTNTK